MSIFYGKFGKQSVKCWRKFGQTLADLLQNSVNVGKCWPRLSTNIGEEIVKFCENVQFETVKNMQILQIILKHLAKWIKIKIHLQKLASIQPRTSLPKSYFMFSRKTLRFIPHNSKSKHNIIIIAVLFNGLGCGQYKVHSMNISTKYTQI